MTALSDAVELTGRICYLRVRMVGVKANEGTAYVSLVERNGSDVEPGVEYRVPVGAVIPGKVVEEEMR